MKRINLTSFGFIRDAASDFSDDGARFYVYRAGKVKVSKTIWNERVYLSGHADIGSLEYQDYSKLAHYKNLDALNGVSIASLTEDDLKKLYADCKAYELEYIQATVQKQLSLPSVSEVTMKLDQASALRQAELDDVLNKVDNYGRDFLLKAPTTYWVASFTDTLKNLKSYVSANRYSINTYLNDDGSLSLRSADVMKPDWSELKPSYYYTKCINALRELA